MNQALIQTTNAYLARSGTGAFKQVSKSEVDQLKAAAVTEQARLLIELLWETGARISEVLDIHVADLNVEKATLKIRRLKRRKVFEQIVPIPGNFANALRLYARAKARRGKIFTANRISAFRTLQALGKKVLGRNISPHQLRHGRTYDLVGRGVHPVVASKALGHASLSSVLAYYHPTEDDLRKALQG